MLAVHSINLKIKMCITAELTEKGHTDTKHEVKGGDC